MKSAVPFITLVIVAIPIWFYGAINQRRMSRERRPPGLRLNPFSAVGLTPKGLVYRRRSLGALVALVAVGVLAFLVGP